MFYPFRKPMPAPCKFEGPHIFTVQNRGKTSHTQLAFMSSCINPYDATCMSTVQAYHS